MRERFVQEINFDGDIIIRDKASNRPISIENLIMFANTFHNSVQQVSELKMENCKLENKIRDYDLTLTLVTANALKDARTEDLILELQCRMVGHIKKSRKYDKLEVKHRKASAYIAELKNQKNKKE